MLENVRSHCVTLGYLTRSIGKSLVLSCLCPAAHLPLCELMQIHILLRNGDYQGCNEFSGFCGGQEDHAVIRTRFSSFYLWGGTKLVVIILKVFRCFFLSVFV